MTQKQEEKQKVKMDYVFSGCAMMRILPRKETEVFHADYIEMRQTVIAEGVKFAKEKCKKMFPQYDIKQSLLYNAYDEPKAGVKFKEANLFNFDNLYADSGGLQAVTRGVNVDSEFKEEIYNKQKIADFAFCFDEIPVEFKDDCTSPEFARTSVDTKHFIAKDFKECAYHTAENINSQLESFEGESTKTFYILQGNTFEEMHDWVRWGSEKIKNIDQICGVAPADTCMGNGPLESCDMMMASKLVFNDFPSMNKQIHLLGVGSATRMYPAIKLAESGFLDSNPLLSFDSSTHPGCLMLGKFFDSRGKKYNQKIQGNDKRSFREFLEFYEDFYSKYVDNYDQEEFLNYLVEDNRCRSIGNIEKDIFETLPKYQNIAGSVTTLYSVWLNTGFFNRCGDMDKARSVIQSPLCLLEDIKTVDDYKHWRRDFKHMIKSQRMDRKLENDLFSLFEY